MRPWSVPGGERVLAFARRLPRHARVGVLAEARLAEGLVEAGWSPVVSWADPKEIEAAPARLDAFVFPFPTRFGRLVEIMGKVHDGLSPGGHAVVCDLAWRTAPTPALARAFAPTAGTEKVRPIEGYEMQLEHAGFEILEREEVPPAEWHPFYGGEPLRLEALAADGRGAACLAVWMLRGA